MLQTQSRLCTDLAIIVTKSIFRKDLKDIKDVTVSTELKSFVDCSTVSDSEN